LSVAGPRDDSSSGRPASDHLLDRRADLLQRRAELVALPLDVTDVRDDRIDRSVAAGERDGPGRAARTRRAPGLAAGTRPARAPRGRRALLACRPRCGCHVALTPRLGFDEPEHRLGAAVDDRVDLEVLPRRGIADFRE